MNAFNRAFAALIALLWIAASAGVLYLMWEPARAVDISNRYLDFAFDITVSGSDRILATLIAAGAIILGLALLAAQSLPGRRAPRAVPPDSDARFRELRDRLDSLQRRVDAGEAGRRPVSPQEPAPSAPGEPRRWGILRR